MTLKRQQAEGQDVVLPQRGRYACCLGSNLDGTKEATEFSTKVPIKNWLLPISEHQLTLRNSEGHSNYRTRTKREITPFIQRLQERGRSWSDRENKWNVSTSKYLLSDNRTYRHNLIDYLDYIRYRVHIPSIYKRRRKAKSQ